VEDEEAKAICMCGSPMAGHSLWDGHAPTSMYDYHNEYPLQPREPTMNYSSAIFLVNDDVRAVSVSYEVDKDGNGVRPFYTFKTMSHDHAIGDYVVVPTTTRHGMTVARVEETDVEVDLDSTVQFKWLIDSVDKAAYDTILAAENEAIIRMKSAEKTRKQRELREKLLEDNPELRALRTFNPASALSPPPAPYSGRPPGSDVPPPTIDPDDEISF